MFVDQMSIATD